MDVHITLSGSGRMQADAYAQLREAVLDGRLRPGERLPPTRDLAARLCVSRNTLLRVYERLTDDGLLEGRAGAGTFVRSDAIGRESRRAPAASALRPVPFYRAPPVTGDTTREAQYDFSVGVPDVALFPYDAWRPLLLREFRRGARRPGYLPPEGDPRARAAIARHVGLARGVRAGADDVLIANGAQQAFDLVARVLVERGACVCVEDPGYPPVRRLLQSFGARVHPVRVDDEGIVVASLPESARLVYVTPSHQFPLGMPMSMRRRLALLEWSKRAGAAIVEDDYDTELRFGGRPLESLQSLDRDGRVIYVGTFSKVLLPSLRLGFVVAPAALQPALRKAKALADGHSPPELQRVLADLIDRGLLARHSRRIVRECRARRARLEEAVERRLGAYGSLVASLAGLHCTFLFRDRRFDLDAFVHRAERARVLVQPLAPYYLRSPRPGIALGFGSIPTHRIDEGVRRLAEAAGAAVRRRRTPA